MDDQLDAAKRRFPAREKAIDDLARRNEDFCTICVDLADAEAAATRWAGSVSAKRDERIAEFKELADDLAMEIEAALNRAMVIPFAGRRP